MRADARKRYEEPKLVDLGSIADHTFCDPMTKPFKGGGVVFHADKHGEWSGGTGPDLSNPTCPPPVHT